MCTCVPSHSLTREGRAGALARSQCTDRSRGGGMERSGRRRDTRGAQGQGQ